MPSNKISRTYQAAWSEFTLNYEGAYRKYHTQIANLDIEKNLNQNFEFWEELEKYRDLCKELGKDGSGKISEQIFHMEKSILPKSMKLAEKANLSILTKVKSIVKIIRKMKDTIQENRAPLSNYANALNEVQTEVNKQLDMIVKQPLQETLKSIKEKYAGASV